MINTEKDFLQIHQVSQFNIRCTLLRGLKAESSDTSSSPPTAAANGATLTCPYKTLQHNALKTRFYTTFTLKERLRGVYSLYFGLGEGETAFSVDFSSALAAVTAKLITK